MVTKGKYNLIVGVKLDCGQSIVVNKLFDDIEKNDQNDQAKRVTQIIALAENKLNPTSLQLFKSFLQKDKDISKELLTIFYNILKNDE